MGRHCNNSKAAHSVYNLFEWARFHQLHIAIMACQKYRGNVYYLPEILVLRETALEEACPMYSCFFESNAILIY